MLEPPRCRGPFVEPHPLGVLVIVAALVGAVKFTGWYPDCVRQKARTKAQHFEQPADPEFFALRRITKKLRKSNVFKTTFLKGIEPAALKKLTIQDAGNPHEVRVREMAASRSDRETTRLSSSKPGRLATSIRDQCEPAALNLLSRRKLSKLPRYSQVH
jgi:hypothetical protein